LSKFIKLIQNEHIKIFSKTSTWILIILMVTISLGYNGFMRFGQYMREDAERLNETADYISGYQNTINYLKETGEAENAAEIAAFEFMIKYEIGYQDWRNAEVVSLFHEKMEAEQESENNPALKKIESRLNLLASNDWRSFFQEKLSAIDSDPSLSPQKKAAKGYYYRYVLAHDLDPIHPDWKSDLAKRVCELKQTVVYLEQNAPSDPELKVELEKTKENLLLSEYRLTKNLKNYARQISYQNFSDIDLWSVLGLSNMLITVISMVIIIIASNSIANEFSSGTIKFLLINPIKRWKIFLSKYITILSVSLLTVLSFFLMNVFFGGIFFGFDNLFAPYLYVAENTVQTLPGLFFILSEYLLGSVNLIVMGTLAFAISSLLRNATVAIGLSLFAMLGGNTVVVFMKNVLNLDWARFFIFANTDLNAVLSGSSIFQYMTVEFSLSVIAVHLLIFFLIAWDGFVRRKSIT